MNKLPPKKNQKNRKPDKPEESLSLEKKLDIVFKNKKLLLLALTHPSYAHENQKGNKKEAHNERLEFLGDSFLGLAISHLLYEKNPQADEGILSQMKSHLVSTKFLAEIAEKLDLRQFLQIGKGRVTGLPTSSMMADALEALIGSLYLDQGYEKAFLWIKKIFRSHLKDSEKEEDNYENHKGQLQELLQRKYKSQPVYRLAAEYGPDHSKTFEVNVLFRGKIFGVGVGKSKKEAEMKAAHQALSLLSRE